jgi:hypothetical protein
VQLLWVKPANVTAKTESEASFEEFFRRNDFTLLLVTVTTTKTPHYTLRTNGHSIVVEVKEVLPTAEERESDRLALERGWGSVISTTPGERVRKKIADCSKQIKARTLGQHPGLLVLWERGQGAGRHTEPDHIRIAMSGFEQVLIDVPPIASGERPSVTGMKHGPGRKMTESANTSISAVALLCVPSPDQMLLQVFHNRHAAIPLPPALLSAPDVRHFVLRDDPERTTDWERVQ